MTHTPVPGIGSLFKNDRKSKPNHPDYKGSLCLPDGSTVQLGGWIKDRNGGGKYLSLTVSQALPPKQEDEP
jgi:uncharacterized protein (DUF736 family)